MRRQFGFARPKGNKGRIFVHLGKLVSAIKVEAHGRIVGRHQARGFFLPRHQQAILSSDRQKFLVLGDGEIVPHLVALHQGIPHEVVVADDVDPLGWSGAALQVVAVIIVP